MSGIPWQQIRGAHIDPSAIRFTDLQNKQNMFENELFKPPTNKLTIISVDTHDRLAYNDNLFFGKLKYRNSRYFMPYEPDGNILRLWLRYNHLGRTIHDNSFWCNSNFTSQILCRGAPRLCKGPDDGVKGGRIVSRLNVGDTLDHFRVANPEEVNIGVLDGQPFSLYFEFMPESLEQHDGLDSTLWAHTDDPNGDYGSVLAINPDGKLIFGINDNASSFDFTSAANKITAGLYHTAFVTYNPANNAITMTINNVPQSDIGGPTPDFPDPIENSIYLGIRGTDDITGGGGKFVGRFADTRWYRGLIVNRDHETNIWNNKRSICAANAINLDGTDDYLDLGNQASLWSQSLTKFSFSFWVYPTIMGDGNDRRIIQHGIASNQGFGTYIDGSTSGRINFRIRNSVGTTITAFNLGLLLNKWNFVLCVYDNSLGSSNLKIYVNGSVGTNANLTEAINLSAVLRIGDTPTHAKGYIRDFRWWTTIPLTATDNDNLFVGNESLVTDPNYWLKLTEGNDVPRDIIARTLTASLNNGAVWNLHSSHRPIEYGKLDVMGYARFNSETYTSGFDAVGFDNVGFDTS